ncbi:MAG: hypothetical protein EBW52_08955, partial [Betaproteobacteria bacterium]|nr:hypothetical protein [Betaproteobacteria bacterium]
AAEISQGRRFEFGANWSRFLSVLNDERIEQATVSLKNMLGIEHLHGKRFLDAGSGSGLFSLAARRLGAHVHSFDYDPSSVACTRELKRRYFPDDNAWKVDEGSPEFDTSRVILGIFGAIVLRNQALRKVARNRLYWQT